MNRNKRRKRKEVRFTTQKDRSVWYFERATFPLRDAPPLELEKAWQVLEHQRQPDKHHWEEAGPFNIAGRVTSLVVPANDCGTMIAGTAGGGVWRSRDRGDHWESIWPLSYSHNIGAIAVHPFPPYCLIVATGEANLSADSYPGSGFFISSDGGQNWQPYFESPDGRPIPDEMRDTIPRRVGTIAFNPADKTTAAIGSVTFTERMPAGLYFISPEEGLQPCTAWGKGSYNCYSVVYHPKIEGTLFAAIEPRGAMNGIWRSEDNGKTWRQMTRGLPPGDAFRRTTLAISRSEPYTIYALAANRDKGVLGIFRSVNGGNSWRDITGDGFPSERFMSYNSTIAIHPDDSDTVIWGGISLHRTKDGGRTWKRITRRVPNTRRNHVHEDHHALLMPEGDLVYSGNDGGVAVSTDGGDTWSDRSQGMATTMFYDVDVAPTSSRIFGGGAQDNGTLVAGVNGKRKGDFERAFPGDGGWIVFDPADAEHVFGSAQDMTIRRHRRGEPWVAWKDKSPSIKQLTQAERSQRDIAVLAIEPAAHKRVKRVWAGTHRLWLSEDDGATWKPATDTFDGSAISAIEIAPADPRILFVGTNKGGIFRSLDGGRKWSENLAGGELPRRLVTRIETHPKDVKRVVVTVASTGVARALLQRKDERFSFRRSLVERKDTPFQKTFSSIFESRDLGRSWKDIDGGMLPNVVFYAALFETRPPHRLFVAGDAGVFVFKKIPNGLQWTPLTGNMPNVVVSDLVYHHKDQLLFAATYGRGIWRLRTDTLKV